ncbi:MAG TPA: type I-E CRISPR-associated protein Cas5/CasD [Bacillota bacterium]
MANPWLLLLRLEGPLQSWGERSRWGYRDTAMMPTRSGIIGILACALGTRRFDPAILELENGLSIGVRADRPGQVIIDYQTISGTIRTADRKQRGGQSGESTLQSYRQYLQDAAFFVVAGGSEELLRRCATALQHPVWPVFLGRKSCIPTRPVYEDLTTEYATIREALEYHPLTLLGSRGECFCCEVESPAGNIMRRDRLTNLPARVFLERTIQTFSANPPRSVER